MFPYTFPPFSVIGKVVRKVQEDKVSIILITHIYQLQQWYLSILKMCIKYITQLLKNPQEAPHPLIKIGSLRLVAWLISNNVWKERKYLKHHLKLIINARRTGTQARYKSTWNKQTAWYE